MQPVMINGQMVEMVDVFKYLGSFIDSNIPFKENTDHIFNVHDASTCYASSIILELAKIFWKLWIRAWWKAFYLLTWSCGNLNLERRIKLQKIVNMTSKILGKPQKQLSRMYYELLRGKSDKIINDPSWQWVHCTVNLNFCHQEGIIDWQRQIGISIVSSAIEVINLFKFMFIYLYSTFRKISIDSMCFK